MKLKNMNELQVTNAATSLFNAQSRVTMSMTDYFEEAQAELSPSQIVDLMTRQLRFAQGNVLNGDMLLTDIEDLEFYASLSSLYGSFTHYVGSVISEDDVATINTIAKASRARLEIMVDEGLDFSDIYEINIDELKVLGLIKVDELAAIASMSLQSVRNDFSKNYNHLQMVSKPEGKYLSVAAARTWLKDKNAYTPTKVDGNFFNDSQTVQVQSDSIYVPIAKDGSFFSKECRMSNGYKVGEKGNEQYIESFQDALTQLKDMPLAKWRRPNAKGHYGLVSAVEWGYKPKTK